MIKINAFCADGLSSLKASSSNCIPERILLTINAFLLPLLKKLLQTIFIEKVKDTSIKDWTKGIIQN